MMAQEKVESVGPDDRCEECGRRAIESRLAPGHYLLSHGGSCSQNSALRPCPRCGLRHVDLSLAQMLACSADLSTEDAQDVARRVLGRLDGNA